MKINVCLATDKNYVKYAGAVIASILKHANNDDELSFYIIEEGLTNKNRQDLFDLKKIRFCCIYFLTPDTNKLPNGKLVKYISRATLFRLQLANLLMGIERVIYLDCDVIVRSSLSELWNTDLENFIAAGVGDYNSNLVEHSKLIGCDDSIYINAGIILWDLNKARNEDIPAQFLKTAERLGDTATLLDQDIINVGLKNRIKKLPLKWNLSVGYFKRRYGFQYYSDEEIRAAAIAPSIVHFTGRAKPWSWLRCKHPYWYEYFKTLNGTKWQNEKWKGMLKKFFLPCRKGSGPGFSQFK